MHVQNKGQRREHERKEVTEIKLLLEEYQNSRIDSDTDDDDTQTQTLLSRIYIPFASQLEDHLIKMSEAPLVKC